VTATHAIVVLSGLAALVAVAMAAILVVRLHLLPTRVDPLREGVSAYALTPWADLYRTQAIGSGAAASCLVIGCGALGTGPVVGLGTLLVYALTRFVIVRYPTDPPGTTVLSATGRAHAALAATSFVSLAVATPLTGLALAGSTPWDLVAPLLVTVSVAVPISVVATFVAGGWSWLRSWFGLIERAVYATGFAWMLIVGAGLTTARAG
jgi:hypothetical protein